MKNKNEQQGFTKYGHKIMRNKKGSVSVKAYRGMLQIYIPNNISDNKYIHLGLPDTPENRLAAEQKARVISSDIAFHTFDPTLEKYKPKAAETKPLPLLSELWEKYTLFKSEHLSTTTIKIDFRRIKNHISKLPTQNSSNSRQIKKYLTTNYTPRTAIKVLAQLSACCQWAVEEELIPSNAFSDLRKIRTKSHKMIDPFSLEEKDLIIQSFADHYKWNHYTDFVRFLFLTGCRTSEAIGLRWGHIDHNLKTIVFQEAIVGKTRKNTKTGKSRKFPVNDQLKEILTRVKPSVCDPEDIVFLSLTGLIIDAHNFLNRTWKEVLEGAGIRYRPQYNTRHTFITMCLEADIPVAHVASWAGNSADTIWKFYAGLIQNINVPIM